MLFQLQYKHDITRLDARLREHDTHSETDEADKKDTCEWHEVRAVRS